MTAWLLGTLLATSGLIMLVLLTREPVRRLFGSRVAYGLWLIPVARLLMPTLTQTAVRPGAVRAPVIPQIPGVEASHLVQGGTWPLLFIALWAAGALVLFAVRMLEFLRQRSAILTAGAEAGRVGSVRILKSAAVRGPVAFGILDRVIALPLDFEARYNTHERRLALEHELAHHRSGDLVANYFAFILLCLQWFNPLAWVAHAAFRFDQETACDARVLEKADRLHRADYGRAIAKAASGRALPLASALDERSSLHRRLACMLHNANAWQRLVGRMIIFTSIAAALPLTATRAVEYIDPPRALAPHSRAVAASAVTTPVDFTPSAARRGAPDVFATNRGHEIVLARGELAKIAPENGEAEAMRSDREPALRDIALDQGERERVREDIEQAKGAQRHAREKIRQPREDGEQVRRGPERELRDLAQFRQDFDQARRDEEQGRRNAEQALRKPLQFRQDADQRQEDRERANEKSQRAQMIKINVRVEV